MQVGVLCDTLVAHCKIRVSEGTTRLLDCVQRLRNDIVHSGGRTSQKLVDRWSELGTKEKALWEEVTRRPPQLTVGDSADVGRREVYATWSIIRRFAREVNDSMATTLPRDVWARLAVEDFESERPTKLADPRRKAEHAMRYLSTRYGALGLTEKELAPFL
jgi:hypothetical protein